MTDWTVVVETSSGAATNELQIQAFRRALYTNPAAHDPAASFDPAVGALAAQFQVTAESSDAAALRACFAYWGAIAASGVAPDAEPTVLVAPLEDAGHAERFSVLVRVRRH